MRLPLYVGYEQDRGSARKRGYTPQWDKASATFKRRHPWCLGCVAIGKKVATDVPDHVVPHKGNQTIFWDTSKWQPACRWHHDAIKPILERMFECGEIVEAELWLNRVTAKKISGRRPSAQAIGVDGWPVA